MVYSNLSTLGLPIEKHFIAHANYFVSNISNSCDTLKLIYGFKD
jgi:hypothetical protein